MPEPTTEPRIVERLTPEQMHDLRTQVLAGARLPPELSQRVVETIRSDRASAAAQAVAKGTSRKKTKVPTDDELFADFDKFLGAAATARGANDGQSGAGPDDEPGGESEV